MKVKKDRKAHGFLGRGNSVGEVINYRLGLNEGRRKRDGGVQNKVWEEPENKVRKAGP